MIQAILGGILFLFAAIWETHVASFLPWYATIYPLWALTVVGLCLESDRMKLGTGLVLALIWEEIARPASTTPIIWLWLLLTVLASWLLRIWLSHRSMWSAVILVVFGRLVWVFVRTIDLQSFSSPELIWKGQMGEWAIMLFWDIVLVVVLLKTALVLSRALSPYLPRFSKRDQI